MAGYHYRFVCEYLYIVSIHTCVHVVSIFGFIHQALARFVVLKQNTKIPRGQLNPHVDILLGLFQTINSQTPDRDIHKYKCNIQCMYIQCFLEIFSRGWGANQYFRGA